MLEALLSLGNMSIQSKTDIFKKSQIKFFLRLHISREVLNYSKGFSKQSCSSPYQAVLSLETE